MNRRKLSSEERDLWRQVAEGTSPLKKPRSDILPVVSKKPKPTLNGNQKSNPLEIGPKAMEPLSTGFKAGSSKLNVKMDHKSFAKMRQGKLIPEAHVDLHGLTVAGAYPALSDFIQSSYAKRLRLILVITGKGNSTNELEFSKKGRGILRKQVPQWLSVAPLSRFVLQVHQSHVRHGGAGAFYVYLKKNKLAF